MPYDPKSLGHLAALVPCAHARGLRFADLEHEFVEAVRLRDEQERLSSEIDARPPSEPVQRDEGFPA